VTFDPRDRRMSRNRGQVLYRFRPNQTFDHAGGYTAQVRQYGRDDAYQGPALDHEYLIQEARQLVRRWRLEGQRAAGAEGGSDLATVRARCRPPGGARLALGLAEHDQPGPGQSVADVNRPTLWGVAELADGRTK
jgi:hypothetical protein